jgi:hypothetical protein
MGFRYFSVNSLESYQSQDYEFSELNAKEVNKGEGFKEGSEVDIDDEFSELDAKELNKGEGFKEGSEVDIDDEFSELDAKEINKGEGFKEGSEVDISSQTEPESVQSKPIDLLFKEAVLSEPVDLVFKEAIGLENMPENKRLNSEIGGMGNLQPESQLEKSRSMLGFQREIINTLRGTVNGLESTIKEIKRKIAALENSEKQMTKNYLELEKSLSGKTHNNTEESYVETEVPENQEKGAKSEKKKRRTTKKVRLKEKPSVDSGVGSLEHPWAEWVQFLEHLNDSGYLSKALNFQGGPIDLRDCSMELLGHHLRFAAQIFAKDHAEISKLLSGSDMRKIALFGCPSLEKKDVFAAKRLRSFFNIEQGTACRPCNLKDTCSAPFAKVSKVRSLTAEDVVRLLCTFGLNAEKNELSIPDDVKQSVVNLLKELVDFSTSSSNGDQGLSLQE